MGYSFSAEAIDNYFIFLIKSDAGNKKKFIMKLTESIESENTIAFNPRSLIGAWEDSRDSDDIIKEINESRVNSPKIGGF